VPDRSGCGPILLHTRQAINIPKPTITEHTALNNRYLDNKYDIYEDQFNPLKTDRKARRKRRPRASSKPRKSREEIVEQLADTAGLESGFEPTYQPSKYEAGWLLESLGSLYDQQLITDVIAQVKGGKEASVYCCTAHKSTGVDLLAAKVYRPRMFRQLRNDKMYRQGRDVIMGDGTRLNESDFREMRAIAKGTAFGKKVSHTSWLMHEYKTLQTLYDAGAAVPRPWAVGDNVILMGYVGDEHLAAPTLNTVKLDPEELEPLFAKVMRNVNLLMAHNLVHGDLSAYNILYWAGEIVLIDFPQVADVRSNPDARFILERDITRVCEYFAEQGLERDPSSLAEELWQQYGYDFDRYEPPAEYD
jgi:RIO kinase 1